MTRHEDNKGDQDATIALHPIVMEHLQKIRHFGRSAFPWNHELTTLYCEFARIQKEAGIHLACHKKHNHTERCYVCGFHDIRRSFASENAANMPAEMLQRLMRRSSYTTTQRYIGMAKCRQRDVVDQLKVPQLKKLSAN